MSTSAHREKRVSLHYDLPSWFRTSDTNQSARLRRYFDTVERPNPITGYEGRDTEWFERHILPDFLAAKARLGLGPTLLDVGCGFGHFTRRFAEYFAVVVGVDFSEARVAGARALNARDNVQYLTLDLVSDRLETHDGHA